MYACNCTCGNEYIIPISAKREIEIERLRRQVANLQKELNEKEQVLKQKKSEDSSVERRTVQLEEEKGA